MNVDRVSTDWKALMGNTKTPQTPRKRKVRELNNIRECKLRALEMTRGRQAAIEYADSHPIYA